MLTEKETIQEKIEKAEMVEFEYKCSVCDERIVGNSLKGGDDSVVIHKRHGEELGRVTGHYNKLGGVIEEDVFSEGAFSSANPGHPNSNDEIWISEFQLEDSRSYEGRKYVGNKTMSIENLRRNYLSRLFSIQMVQNGKAKQNGEPEDDRLVSEIFEKEGHAIKFQDMIDEYEDVEVKSGVVACHKSCYDNLSETEKNNLPISDVFKKSKK